LPPQELRCRAVPAEAPLLRGPHISALLLARAVARPSPGATSCRPWCAGTWYAAAFIGLVVQSYSLIRASRACYPSNLALILYCRWARVSSRSCCMPIYVSVRSFSMHSSSKSTSNIRIKVPSSIKSVWFTMASSPTHSSLWASSWALKSQSKVSLRVAAN